MRFVTIFEPNLYAIVLDENGEDEFNRFIDFLTDVEQLEQYFNENPDVLDFYSLSIEEAVDSSMDMAVEIYDLLRENKQNLDLVFEPLKRYGDEILCARMKYRQNWVRLYAVRIQKKYYVITGGAIKQSQKMKGHPETIKQLDRLNKLRDFLKRNGIFDCEGFFELLRDN